MPASSQSPLLVLGRYALYGEVATGGMATVHYGRLLGSAGFSRTVAIKRLHPQFAKDPEFVRMFLDEARLAGRIRHPNVVPTLDVVAEESELFLVMEYVQGESASRLVRTIQTRREQIPLDVVSAIVCGALHGLHAAHEATDERGNPLHVVHRDVSPQNILVGADGVPRVLDFGIAKAAGHSQHTREGQLKGKLSYMAPEQLRAEPVDRRTDVFAAGIVLWEMLTLQRLFAGDNVGTIVTSVLSKEVPPPSAFAGSVPRKLDAITMRALERDPTRRFGSAREFALALEQCVPIASPSRVSQWVQGLVGDLLSERARTVSEIESASLDGIQAVPAGSMPSIPDIQSRPVPTDGTPSQLSTISVSTAKRPNRASGERHRMAIAVGVLGGFVAAAAVLTILIIHRGTAGAAAPVSSAVAASASSTAPGQQKTEPKATASAARGTDTTAPAAAVSAANPPTAAAHDAGATSKASTKAAQPKTAAPKAAWHPAVRAKPRCRIVTHTDSQGIEHFEKECGP